METLVKCNNCGHITSDEGLTQLKDDEGFFKGCETCETDEYLMDIDLDTATLQDLDLFECYELLPKEVQDILIDFGDKDSYTDYEELKSKLKIYGYTFEYTLNGDAHSLRKIK